MADRPGHVQYILEAARTLQEAVVHASHEKQIDSFRTNSSSCTLARQQEAAVSQHCGMLLLCHSSSATTLLVLAKRPWLMSWWPCQLYFHRLGTHSLLVCSMALTIVTYCSCKSHGLCCCCCAGRKDCTCRPHDALQHTYMCLQDSSYTCWPYSCSHYCMQCC
jgi:hypothetical protein